MFQVLLEKRLHKCTQPSKLIKHRTTRCRWARFIVCELYLNKIDNCMSNFSLTLKRTLCLKSLEEIMEKHALLTVLPCVLIFF